MMYTMDLIHALFPLVSFILLMIGIKTQHKNYIIIALWISLIAVILHYQISGGEILGTYFNYFHTLIYTINLLVILIAIIYLIFSFSKESNKNLVRYVMSLLAACSLTGILILLGNLWINARFVEDRYPDTPILQVATFTKLDYCNHNYVFYKVSHEGKISFMCPNYYGLLPSVGYLEVAPDYVIKQLPAPLQAKFQSSPAKKT